MPQQSLDKNIVKASWGNRGGMGSSAKRGVSATSGYHYGSTSESGVVAHWKMQESGSPIVDSKTLSNFTSQYGPMTYQVAGTGLWSAFKGITFPGIPTYGDFKNDSYTACNLGITREWVAEFVATVNAGGAAECTAFSQEDAAGSLGWYVTLVSGNGLFWRVQLTATDSSWIAASDFYGVTSTSPVGDGQIHKFRCVCTGSKITMYVDGVAQNPNYPSGYDISSLDGKDVSATHANIGSAIGGNNPYKGTIYECRITIGNATNNSGGPGGG